MAKALRTIAVIAGSIALIATGVGAAAGAAGLAGVASAGTIATIGTAATIAAGVASVGSQLLAPKPIARGSPAQVTIDAEPPRPYVVGQVMVGGVMRHDVGYGATRNKVPNPYRWQVRVLSGVGPIQGIAGEYFDFDPIDNGFYGGFFNSTQSLGARPQTSALVPPYGAAPGWDSTSKLSGCAHVGLNFLFDRDGKRFASGIPIYTALVDGEKVYDPRQDSTYPGGSGPCRAGVESTYVFNANPACHALTYVLGRFQNGTRIFGLGQPVDTIDLAAIVDWANDCDANEWTVNMVLTEGGTGANLREQRVKNLDDLCASGGGRWYLAGGMLSFDWHRPRISLATLTDDDILEAGGGTDAVQTVRNRMNGVRPQYVSPAHNWQQITAEEIVGSTYRTEDGQKLTQVYPLNGVTNPEQAGELASYAMADSRELGPMDLQAKAKWRFYRPGDCITINSSLVAYQGQAVVNQRSLNPQSFAVALSFKSETPGKHDFALGKVADPPPTPILAQTAEERDLLADALRRPRASEVDYDGGETAEDLKPAEVDATRGAIVPVPGSGVQGNVRDNTGRIYDPGELLNTSISITPSGRLEYRPLPNIPPIPLGSITLPDLGAVSSASFRRAEDDIDQLSRALAVALDEASRTRDTFTDAGFYADPSTGQVRIHAIEQTRERVSSAEVRLNAAEASINLRATSTYVDQQIALAAINPSQTADLTAVFSRLTAAEVDIDGLQATVTTLATATELSLVSGRVTTAQSEIDALEGVVSTKVDTTTFNTLATRVTSAESTLTAFGDAASILNSVTAIRLIERDQDAGAENDLRVLLQGDRQQRDQVAAIASARQEITARLIEGDAAEAAARLALQVRIGEVEATAATETVARISGDTALAAQITALTASTNTSVAALNASITIETAARTSADSALSTSISNLAASLSDLDSELTASITAADQARVSGDNALAASITNLTASLNTAVANLNASVDTEAQARIDGDALIAAGLAQQVTAGRVAEGEAAALAEELLGALVTGDKSRRETNGIIAGVRQEIVAQIVENEQAIASSLTALTARVRGNEVSIIAESQARASAIEVVAQSITSLNASFTTAIATEASARNTAIAQATNNLGSDIITERDARIAAIQAEAAARGTALTAEEQARIAAINAEAAARQAAIAAEQAAREQAVTTLTASIQAESTARANADSALASQITTLTATATGRNRTFRQGAAPSGPVPGDLWLNSAAGNAMLRWDGSTWVPVDDTRIADNAAAITLANQVRADADSALATSITNLTTTVNGNTASINQFAESINGLRARVGVRLDVNGRVTGWVLNSNAQQSSFDVVADSFRIFAPGMEVAQAPFEFSGGNLRLAGNIRVGGDAIIDGSLSAGALVADGVTRTYFGQNSTSFSLVPDVVDNLVSITIEMERPGTIILIGSFIFTYASGSWSANIAVDGATLQSGTSNNDRYASFNGAFFASSAGTYVARMRASGNACSVNAGGATLTVLRTYA